MDDIRKVPRREPARPFPLPPLSPEAGPAFLPPTLSRPQPKKRPLLRLSLATLFVGLTLLLGGLGFLVFKSIAVGERMQFENKEAPSFAASLQGLTRAFLGKKTAALSGEQEGRINILLLGRAGASYPGRNLTDTVMIMSIDTDHKKVALLSLPRDLYVPIADTHLYTKINSLYQYGLSQNQGIEPVRQTVEAITGEPIHYFMTIDFDGFEKVVDTLGGISVDVVRDFYDPRYPGKNYSYETFEIKKGWQTLDGATALKYVRERHNDPEGDFGRAKRQQQVIQAIKNKAFSLGTLFNIVTVNRLLDTLGESVKTDMSLEEMGRFLELAKTLDTKNVTTVVIDAWKRESLLRVSHLQVGNIAAFILVPRVGNWSEIQSVSATLFQRDEETKRRNAIQTEAPTLTLFVKREHMKAAENMTALLKEELGFASVTTAFLAPLDNAPEKSIIVMRSGLNKPFALDELLKRFSLTKVPSLPFSIINPTTDFSLVLGTDLTEAFSLEETTISIPEDPSFSEPLPPQPKK